MTCRVQQSFRFLAKTKSDEPSLKSSTSLSVVAADVDRECEELEKRRVTESATTKKVPEKGSVSSSDLE